MHKAHPDAVLLAASRARTSATLVSYLRSCLILRHLVRIRQVQHAKLLLTRSRILSRPPLWPNGHSPSQSEKERGTDIRLDGKSGERPQQLADSIAKITTRETVRRRRGTVRHVLYRMRKMKKPPALESLSWSFKLCSCSRWTLARYTASLLYSPQYPLCSRIRSISNFLFPGFRLFFVSAYSAGHSFCSVFSS